MLRHTPPCLTSLLPMPAPLPPLSIRLAPPSSSAHHKVFAQAGGFQRLSTMDVTTETVPVLVGNEVVERLRGAGHANWALYKAMYSSVVGGIITDPALMLVPVDDHMVHRGHAVFDTALIINGWMYELEPHLSRFFSSASAARISPPFSREELRQIIIQTAAASGTRDGHIRYWMSAGPGGFTLSTKECPLSSFYAMVIEKPLKKAPLPQNGVKVITSSVPMKPSMFATMKNVNYLPNALVKMEAEERGAFDGVWVDAKGDVAEGPSMNVAFVDEDGVLLVPDFSAILAGCTMKRVMKLAEELTRGSSEVGPLLSGIKLGPVNAEVARMAKEMMLVGSGVLVEAVVQWDDQIIGDGKPGQVTSALRSLLDQDLFAGPDRIKIPYAT